MALKLAILIFAAAAASAEIKPGGLKEKFQVEQSRAFEAQAQDALSGMYTECFAQVSFACLQRKVLSFVHRMGRMEQFNVLGRFLSVVKVRDENESESEFQGRMATATQEDTLDDLMESTIDRFFNNHVIRVKLPTSLMVRSEDSRSSDTVDLQFPFTDEVEGRKKGGGGGGGGGGKMGKKMMMMMMMGIKAKLMMLGPMMMGLAGLMAMKALIAGVVSLTISKIMIIKKLMKQKGGGGGGGHSSGWDSSGGSSGGWSSSGGGGGGGGGWDRRSHSYSTQQDNSWDPQDLAYRAYSTIENIL